MATYSLKSIAPKIRELEKSKETFSSFESWRGNLIYNLTLNPNFAEFIDEDCVWKKNLKIDIEVLLMLLRLIMKEKSGLLRLQLNGQASLISVWE